MTPRATAWVGDHFLALLQHGQQRLHPHRQLHPRPRGQQLTELDWAGATVSNWHTNVWAGGQLVGTYSPNLDPETSAQNPSTLNYYLTDWLGSRRVMTDSQGNVASACASLPYGRVAHI